MLSVSMFLSDFYLSALKYSMIIHTKKTKSRRINYAFFHFLFRMRRNVTVTWVSKTLPTSLSYKIETFYQKQQRHFTAEKYFSLHFSLSPFHLFKTKLLPLSYTVTVCCVDEVEQSVSCFLFNHGNTVGQEDSEI